MMIFKVGAVLIISMMLISCRSIGAFHPLYQNPKPFCQTPHRQRQTIPIKTFYEHPTYWSLLNKNNKNYWIQQLSHYNMEFIRYRDIITVIIPVDQYFEFNSSRLDERQYPGLNHLVNLIYLYPCTTVHVAAFADNVGTREENNQLTEAQAEAMLTYLWANGIPAENLNAQGFGLRFPIADNHTTRGSAMNRRIEIQWTTKPDTSTHDIDLSQK